MKIAATIARYLLGIIFLFFGSNLLFHFLPNPPMPPGPMSDFSSALFVTHYIFTRRSFSGRACDPAAHQPLCPARRSRFSPE